MTLVSRYPQTVFLKSAQRLEHLPPDEGCEVAFAGRSNAGKSSALNCLTANKQLARTSKTPGRTQLINLFSLDETRRLVDLPGYGYAKVPQQVKQVWQDTLAQYLETRQCLRGLILLMDCRHPLKDLDQRMIDWAITRPLSVHILLTKTDKLSRSAVNNALSEVRRHYQYVSEYVSVQAFSSHNKTGLDTLVKQLDDWFEYRN